MTSEKLPVKLFFLAALATSWTSLPVLSSPVSENNVSLSQNANTRHVRAPRPVPALPRSGEVVSIEFFPWDCSGYRLRSHKSSGVYKVQPKYSRDPVEVYCDTETRGGGWTVFQRRDDFCEPSRRDFYLDWIDYKEGFGDLTKEFWLGNENLFVLTNQEPMSLRIDLEDWEGERRHALYDTFLVRSENELYTAIFGSYSGNAGDAMSPLCNNTAFSTKDRSLPRLLNIAVSRDMHVN